MGLKWVWCGICAKYLTFDTYPTSTVDALRTTIIASIQTRHYYIHSLTKYTCTPTDTTALFVDFESLIHFSPIYFTEHLTSDHSLHNTSPLYTSLTSRHTLYFTSLSELMSHTSCRFLLILAKGRLSNRNWSF